MSRLGESKPPFTEIALEAVKKIHQPLLLYGIVESVLLSFLLVMGREVPNGLLPIVYTLSGLILLVAIGHFSLEYRDLRAKYLAQISSSTSGDVTQTELTPDASLRRVFCQSDNSEFVMCMENLMSEAQRIVLMGTGLNILFRDPIRKKLIKRATDGDCTLEIYLADPISPDIETRLIEEELGNDEVPVGQTGLLRHLDTLLQSWRNHGRPDTISIRVFTHYPTFALLIVDSEYFIYPYGYATLGNFSPVFRFSKDVPADQPAIAFLDQQYKQVKASALDAEELFEIRNNINIAADKLLPFALYFIPAQNSDLYQFGTQILGYDVRERILRETSWQKEVGGACDFGFHLTLCDVLYFQNQAEVKRVTVEIEFLSREFLPFNLTELRLEPSFPDATSFSIMMDDPSGSLEALHHELIHRVYRRAVASNYSLRLTKLSRDLDFQRAELMIKKYRAPYIFHRFCPHLSLLTNVPSEEQSNIHQKLERLFSERVKERSIRVEKLAVMSRPKVNALWVIEKEIKLG